MTETVTDFITTGVEVFLSAFLITVFLTVGTVTNNLNQEISYRDTLAQELQEYRKVNQWDGKDVTQADVIQCILTSRGEPGVLVQIGGSTLKWTTVTKSTDYTAEAIGTVVSNDYMYHASIDNTSGNGQVVSIAFEAVSP